MARTANHSPVLKRLEALVGEWEMRASDDGKELARGRTRFAWIEGGAFLIQRAEADPPTEATPPGWIANSPFPVTTIIGLDDASETFSYVYSDARGVRRVYTMRLDGARWEIEGRPGPEFFQRFSATFSDDGDAIAGRWEGSPDGAAWELDFEVSYTRLGARLS